LQNSQKNKGHKNCHVDTLTDVKQKKRRCLFHKKINTSFHESQTKKKNTLLLLTKSKISFVKRVKKNNNEAN